MNSSNVDICSRIFVGSSSSSSSSSSPSKGLGFEVGRVRVVGVARTPVAYGVRG